MELENVKTWQWMIAGIVVGFLFSGIVAWSGPAFDTQARDTIEQGEFENDAFALANTKGQFGESQPWAVRQYIEKYHKDKPLLSDVTVHPPVASDPQHRYWVTGRAYFAGVQAVDPKKAGSPMQAYEEWRPFKYSAPTPYVPGYQAAISKDEKNTGRKADRTKVQIVQDTALKTALGGKDSFPSVVEYLKAVKALPDSKFTYQLAFWERPNCLWTLPPLAGFLMIGVAWPLTLSIMQNYGAVKPAPMPVKSIEPERKPIRAASTAGVKVIPPVAAKAPPSPQDVKKYGGEFYPVVKSTNKE